MDKKRFRLVAIKPGTHSNIWDYEKIHRDGVGGELWMGEVVDKLNRLNEENKKLQIEVKELNRKYNAFYDMVNERLSEMSFDYLIQPYKDRNAKLEDDLSFQKEMKKMLGQEIERLQKENEILKKKLGD